MSGLQNDSQIHVHVTMIHVRVSKVMEEKRESIQQRAGEQPEGGSREATAETSLATGDSIWLAESLLLCKCVDPVPLASVLTLNHTKNVIEHHRKR